jgi:hypothetical protein
MDSRLKLIVPPFQVEERRLSGVASSPVSASKAFKLQVWLAGVNGLAPERTIRFIPAQGRRFRWSILLE